MHFMIFARLRGVEASLKICILNQLLSFCKDGEYHLSPQSKTVSLKLHILNGVGAGSFLTSPSGPIQRTVFAS